MKIGPQYKIARRLGAPIFEKTQTAKFQLSLEKKSRGRGRPKTDFGLQMAEKQKARFFYGITEKQFKNYVKKVLDDSKVAPATGLFSLLESRLDNVVWRIGLAPTHRGARLLVAHGHILVNGRRTYTPSYIVKEGDKITIREASKNKGMWKEEKDEKITLPVWISFDNSKKEAEIKGKASLGDTETLFDMGKVIEFYQR